jgi:hypothetical protein
MQLGKKFKQDAKADRETQGLRGKDELFINNLNEIGAENHRNNLGIVESELNEKSNLEDSNL